MRKKCTTVLIVDDDPADRILIKRALESVGPNASMHFMADGAEAISYLKAEGKYADRNQYEYPSAIITDLKMPRSDGFALLSYLKENPHKAIIPVVVLSSSNDPDDVRRAYALGATAYHMKPSSSDQLRTLFRLMHDYWMTCEVPDTDNTGQHLPTNSAGKIGERFEKLEA